MKGRARSFAEILKASEENYKRHYYHKRNTFKKVNNKGWSVGQKYIVHMCIYRKNYIHRVIYRAIDIKATKDNIFVYTCDKCKTWYRDFDKIIFVMIERDNTKHKVILEK